MSECACQSYLGLMLLAFLPSIKLISLTLQYFVKVVGFLKEPSLFFCLQFLPLLSLLSLLLLSGESLLFFLKSLLL